RCSSCSRPPSTAITSTPSNRRTTRCCAASRPTSATTARRRIRCRSTAVPAHTPPRRDRLPLDSGDRSIEIHACHGRARQVEVLRDAILHLLEDDPTLEPRDVIVIRPTIETCAPLIQATFGAGEVAAEDEETVPERAQRPDLRVRLADRSLR